MSIYDINFSIAAERLSPPLMRMPRYLAWMTSLVQPLQWLRDRTFNDYVTGNNASNYNVLTQYAIGDKVKHTDKALYEAMAIPPIGTIPTDETYWIKIADIWIGARERAAYNSNVLLFEYALNKYFETTFRNPDDVSTPTRSDIYIENLPTTNNVFIAENYANSSFVYKSDLNAIKYVRKTYSFDNDNFEIFVPTAVFDALSDNDTTRESIIRTYVDKYNLAGIKYKITQY